MINKYLDEVNVLVSKGVDREDIELLLRIASGEQIDVDKKYLTDKILDDLFNNGYTQDILIPLSFLDTEIGKALGRVRFYMHKEKKYRVKDICDVTGYSRQYISEEIENGNIVCEREGRNIYFNEVEFNKYLEKKGFKSLSEEKELKYNEVKDEFRTVNFEREEGYNYDK